MTQESAIVYSKQFMTPLIAKLMLSDCIFTPSDSDEEYVDSWFDTTSQPGYVAPCQTIENGKAVTIKNPAKEMCKQCAITEYCNIKAE